MKVAAFIQLFMVTSLAGLGDDVYIDHTDVGARGPTHSLKLHTSPLYESHVKDAEVELRMGQCGNDVCAYSVGCAVRTTTATVARKTVLNDVRALVRTAHPTSFLQLETFQIVSEGKSRMGLLCH